MAAASSGEMEVLNAEETETDVSLRGCTDAGRPFGSEFSSASWGKRGQPELRHLWNRCSMAALVLRLLKTPAVQAVPLFPPFPQSTLRCKAEHGFGVMKLKFGFMKVRYRGLIDCSTASALQNFLTDSRSLSVRDTNSNPWLRCS